MAYCNTLKVNSVFGGTKIREQMLKRWLETHEWLIQSRRIPNKVEGYRMAMNKSIGIG